MNQRPLPDNPAPRIFRWILAALVAWAIVAVALWRH